MRNWSVDVKQLKKHPAAYAKWRLEQLVNFGLHNEKINKRTLKKYWSQLTLDPHKKAYLTWLLWPSKRS